MAAKNVNNNTNHVSIHLNVEPTTAATPEKRDTHWLKKLVVGGIITLAVAVCGHYFMRKMDEKGKSAIKPRTNEKPIMSN